MKLSELLDICKSFRPDDEVVIHVNKPSIGSIAMVPIKSISSGFDWEQGRVIIRSEVPLVPKSNKEKLFDDVQSYCARSPNKALAKEAQRLILKSGCDPKTLAEILDPKSCLYKDRIG